MKKYCVHRIHFIWMGFCNQLHLVPTYCFSFTPAVSLERIFFVLMLCLKDLPYLFLPHSLASFTCHHFSTVAVFFFFSLVSTSKFFLSLHHYLNCMDIQTTSELQFLLRFYLKQRFFQKSVKTRNLKSTLLNVAFQCDIHKYSLINGSELRLIIVIAIINNYFLKCIYDKESDL